MPCMPAHRIRVCGAFSFVRGQGYDRVTISHDYVEYRESSDDCHRRPLNNTSRRTRQATTTTSSRKDSRELPENGIVKSPRLFR
ncbi:hypothetical protein ALC53_13306 [Atta colombica]|uniref:Uncharacterized protein n=1 Tax=Atta colombica TaxID=520822 RepID=A0A195AWD6_9HYME|nr:hypothetical protein ALC53_13306 [Atta colombica]